MAMDIEWRPEVGKKVQAFFDDPGYRDYLENAVGFNRKLNEERKMRLPYIDGQTGVAQRHYNAMRQRRERMPPFNKKGQLYAYPQKPWHKKRYQYLKYFMTPKIRFDPDADMHTISQVENPGAAPAGPPGLPGGPLGVHGEDSNASLSGPGKDEGSKGGEGWTYYDDDPFGDGEGDDFHSDSDFENDFDVSYGSGRKKKGGPVATPARGRGRGRSGGGRSGGSGGGGGSSKRRTHADSIPDSEKPFSCDLCGARYKTRPGLTYHVKHTHNDKDGNPIPHPTMSMGGNTSPGGINASVPPPHMAGANDDAIGHEVEGMSAPSSVGGSTSLTPPSTPGGPGGNTKDGGAADNTASGDYPTGRTTSRRSTAGSVSYRESDMAEYGMMRNEEALLSSAHSASHHHHHHQQQQQHQQPSATPSTPKKIMVDGRERAVSLGYCDFCLGDSTNNKKTGKVEELVACAECGRSAHPSCLQFTENMIVSVKKYPWQCIECKCCTLCGTSENDDQLLFCDDCDRGYHMYCLNPPIKEPPEGSWSCDLCIETFHKKPK